MQGITLAEQGHFVNVLPPQDAAGGVTGDRFKMENYGHATIYISIGSSAAAPTITLNEATAATSGSTTAIAFDYYAETTSAGDTLGARTAATTSGITASGNDNIMYVIEIDARALTDGYPWLELVVTQDSADSCLVSAVAILTGGRYQNDQNATALV